MAEPTREVNWCDLTDQTLQDRLAERLFGATVDSVTFIDIRGIKHIQVTFDNGVMLMFEDGYLGLDE